MLAQIDKTILTTQVKIGKVLDEILLACAQHDLLVLGAHGLNPLRDLILGTTATRLLRKSMRPVLVVKQALSKIRDLVGGSMLPPIGSVM